MWVVHAARCHLVPLGLVLIHAVTNGFGGKGYVHELVFKWDVPILARSVDVVQAKGFIRPASLETIFVQFLEVPPVNGKLMNGHFLERAGGR